MRTAARVSALVLSVLAGLAQAQITNFQHIVLIVQENRTPDNLFQGLCLPPYGSASACGTGPNQFDIQSYGFDKFGNKIILNPVPLANPFDPAHAHWAFIAMCNPNKTTYYPCQQNTRLDPTDCPSDCPFQYVDPTTTPTIHPYLYLAQNFGWANRMFQTNQGPSAPAHQFLFGGTSALTAAADAQATFVSENSFGCVAPLDYPYYLIDPTHAPYEVRLLNNPPGQVCATHDTMATLLQTKQRTWEYYAVGNVADGTSHSIWNAPLWIQAICQPDSNFTQCTGSDWMNNVDLHPPDVLLDFQNCNLANMVWVTPGGRYSDHPSDSSSNPNDGGPAWVANVINGVSNSPCKDTVNGVAVPYWQDTAIIVVWDDWGGFYDHVLPPFLSAPKAGAGDYGMGFRVPLIFVSAYTSPTIDSTNQYDFGSILRFVEQNFGITEGALGFADQRSSTDLRAFYNFTQIPKKFQIPTTVSASFFLNDTRPPEPPDTE